MVNASFIAEGYRRALKLVPVPPEHAALQIGCG